MVEGYSPRRILIYKGKHDDTIYFARDRREEQLACLSIFVYHEKYHFYDHEMGGDESLLYLKAKSGDLESVRQFIHLRSDLGCEYESVQIGHVHVPREKDAEDKSESKV
jgi:hypothetical protein